MKAAQATQARSGTGGKKRYNLVLPEELFEEVENIAAEHHTSVTEILRKFIRLGLIALQTDEDNNKPTLIIREGELEREVLLL